MIVSIAQPAYLPWLGYFDRIHRSDLAIVLDHVQFERRGYTHRNRIRGASGPLWLTVPMENKGNRQSPICGMRVCNETNWEHKHRESLRNCYARAPFFETYYSGLSGFYGRGWSELNPLLRESTDFLLEALGIATPRRYSSEMGVSGTKSELILNLCREVGATTYISGPFGRQYLDEAAFAACGVSIEYHDYRHPEYRQVGEGFVPLLSVVDLLFNCGPASLGILGSAGEVRP